MTSEKPSRYSSMSKEEQKIADLILLGYDTRMETPIIGKLGEQVINLARECHQLLIDKDILALKDKIDELHAISTELHRVMTLLKDGTGMEPIRFIEVEKS
jgi:hypothetical protein